jgi:hypothetical protein
MSRDARRFGGSTHNATLYATGGEILRMIKGSKSIKFSKYNFYENANWFDMIDSDGLEKQSNILKRAKRISKMYDIPFFWKDSHAPSYVLGSNRGRVYDRYYTTKPSIYFYEKDNRFLSSMPMIEIGGQSSDYLHTKESDAIRHSCEVGCIACRTLNNSSPANNKKNSIIEIRVKENARPDFNARFEGMCPTHFKQFMKRIDGYISEEKAQDIVISNEGELIELIGFIAEKDNFRKKRDDK